MLSAAALFVAGLMSKKLLEKVAEKSVNHLLSEATKRIKNGEYPPNHTIDTTLDTAIKDSVLVLARRLHNPRTKGLLDTLKSPALHGHLLDELVGALSGGLPDGLVGEGSWLRLLQDAAEDDHKRKSFSTDRLLKADDGHNIGRFLEGKATDLFRDHLRDELLRWVDADADLRRNGHRPPRFETFVREGNPAHDGELLLPAFGDLVLIFFRERIKNDEVGCRAVMFNLLTGQQCQLDDVQAKLDQVLAALAKQHPDAGLPTNWDGFWTGFKSYLDAQFAEMFAQLRSIKDDTAATRIVVVETAETIAEQKALLTDIHAAVTAPRPPQPTSLHRLPPRPEGFVGRTTDLAMLRALNPAAGAVLTSLKGMGGIGKTALALVLAHEWAPRFPDAQLKLDGQGTQPIPPGAGDLIAQVIQAFHPTAKLPEDLDALKGIYHDTLNGKKVLILLDNASGAAQAAPLIPPPGCALIVTSRRTFMLGTVRPHDVGRLPDAEATALLRRLHDALNDADAAALVKLCAGLPLALRLAGAHLALATSERGGPPDVAAYLRALGGGRLATLDRDAEDAGEITISETLRLSEAQLPETERAAWRKLGVFTAPFEARAAAAISGADDEMLGHFVRRSLLEREGAERCKLHDLAADYARLQLPGDALAALHLAHARHYTVVGGETDDLYLKGDAVGGLALFDRERAHLEAAYAWLDGQAGRAVPSAPPGGRAALPRGRGDEVSDISASSRRAEDSPPYLAARQMLTLVNAVVYTAALRFHPRQRIAWLESQLRAARLVKDREHEGSALGNLGLAHADLGDARKAIGFYEQQLVIAREIGDRRGEGNALGNLGLAHADLGDARQAIGFYEQRLVIAREIGDRRGEGNALGNLGNAHAALGDARKAIAYHEQALVVSREIGDRRAEGSILGNLGNAHAALGDARQAIGFYEQRLVIAREIGDRRGEGNALGNLGLAHAALGDARKAIGFYEQYLAIAREIGDRRGEGNALGNLGLAHAALGDARKAIGFYEQYLAIAREIGDRRGEGNALGNLGLAHAALGDARQAIAYHEQQLVIVREIGDRRGEGNALWNSALALDSLGNRPEAIVRAAAALAIFEAIESPHAAIVRAELAEWRGT